MRHYPTVCGDTIEDHYVSATNIVQAVAEFVHQNTVVFEECHLHGWTTDVELLKHVDANQHRST